MFQSTHPRRVWHVIKLVLTGDPSFNPHTHEGCDMLESKLYEIGYVSIHTPTKGVTICFLNYFRCGMFQSTHPRRVWRQKTKCIHNHFKFQSTHPRRVWLIFIFGIPHLLRFNPHTHEGCDRKSKNQKRYHLSFNPHTHEGCDWTSETFLLRLISFNPHTHEGCDDELTQRCYKESVSIHTPTKGVTVTTFLDVEPS